MTGIFVPWLADAARLTGYPVVEVSGWQNRGASGGVGMSVVEGVVGHHTAGPKEGEYPSYNVVLNGRPGLTGPLSHYGIGRSGTIYVFGAGKANHAGVSDWAGFTSLNDKFIGIEAEDDGDGIWTPEQIDVYPRLVAAILYYMRRNADRYASHRSVANPAGRKIDPSGIDDAWMRSQVQVYLNNVALITKGSVVVTGPIAAAPVRKTVVVYGVGDRGSAVRDIQTKLIAHGFKVGRSGADGIFGNDTKNAVVAFQTSRHIDVDGLVGPQTLAKLNEAVAAPAPSIPAFPGTVKRGSRGSAVKAVQQRLRDRGWKIDVDGIFGAGTEAVVKAFQRDKRLPDDGIAGPNTWKALWNSPIT